MSDGIIDDVYINKYQSRRGLITPCNVLINITEVSGGTPELSRTFSVFVFSFLFFL